MSQPVAILLIFQIALASIAAFLLVDGPKWVCGHIRVIALWMVFVLGIVEIILMIRWALTELTMTALGFIGLTGAACLSSMFIIARDLCKRHSRRNMRRGYRKNRAEDEWLVFDGQVELGPFSTVELVERISNGEIMPSDHVWKPGMDRWRPVYAAGLQRLAVQPEAIPLSNVRNHPQALQSGCPAFSRRCAPVDGAIVDTVSSRAHAISWDVRTLVHPGPQHAPSLSIMSL